VFYTKVYNRMLVALTAADQHQAPPELRNALTTITRHSTSTPPRPAFLAPRENLTQVSRTSRPKITSGDDNRPRIATVV
jgi:hypothetical protein